MNGNDDSKDKESLRDLRLLRNYSNQGTSHLIENSGAGANAASRLGMTFVASDHLTELVWSPRKGLSIKCTNCSAAAEESRRMLAMGIENKDNEVKMAKAGTVEIACQSACTPINEGSRCNSSPCLKNMSEPPMFKVSSRKRYSHTINKHKILRLHEKGENPQLSLEPVIDEVNQHSTPVSEENQKVMAFKMQDADVSVVKGKSYASEDSPSEGKINEYIRKGKGKVISDANVEHGERESRGSIESCSSVGSFCSQQRKRILEQKLTSESKKIKKDILQSPRPMSLANGSSSFISWIANMTKGTNKENKDGTPCLALTCTPQDQTENPKMELIPFMSNDNNPRQRTGFHNIFQSLYRASSKVHDQHEITDGHQKRGRPVDSCIRNNTMVNVAPLSMYEMTSSSCKGDQSSGNGEKRLQLQNVLSRIGNTTERSASENSGSYNLLTKVQNITLNTSRLSPHICGTQNIDPNPSPEINEGLIDVSDPLQSFWITRFCPRHIVPKSVTDNHGHILVIDNQAKISNNNISQCSDLNKVVQASGELNEDIDQPPCGQGFVLASDSDASVGVKEDGKYITQASDCNIDQIFISETQKSSEAMASMFARRLDAIKNMSPTDRTGNALCHPNDEFLKMPDGRRKKELVFKNKDTPEADIPYTPSNQNNLEPNPELYQLYSKSRPVELELEASALAHLPNSIDVQSSDILKGYFDAIRLLRLSRREILKLMDSQMDLSNLEGYFLRLRVGNTEKENVGNGYHVAYIDGVKREELRQGSKFILPMNMGGIKILVGSPSISNQEFLEDELIGWWSSSVKNGNKLPTLEELNDKLQQRNKLQL